MRIILIAFAYTVFMGIIALYLQTIMKIGENLKENNDGQSDDGINC